MKRKNDSMGQEKAKTRMKRKDKGCKEQKRDTVKRIMKRKKSENEERSKRSNSDRQGHGKETLEN